MAHILVFKLKENKFYIHQTVLPFMDAAKVTNAFINKNQQELDELLYDTVRKIHNKSNWVKLYPIVSLWEIRAVADLFSVNQVENDMKQYYITKFGKNNVNNDKFEIDYSVVDNTTNNNINKDVINNIKNISSNISRIMENYDEISEDILYRHYQILTKIETSLKDLQDKLENLIK